MASNETKGADLDSKALPSGTSSSTSLDAAERSNRIKDLSDCAFDTSEDPRYYKPIPSYEGIHRWDPDFDWEEEEEKRVLRKVFPYYKSHRT